MSDNVIDRKSLVLNLEQRYLTQPVGGAYDAKKGTPDIFGIQEKFWTSPGFAGKGEEGLGTKGRKSIEQSLCRQGFTNIKYKS